jgi:hypothetical protein
MAAEHGLASRPGVRGGSQHPILHEPKNNGHDLSYGGSSMGIPAKCAGTITIAEFDQNRRGWRTALQYRPADQGAFRCRTCFRRGVDSARYVADLAYSHAGREYHGV